MTEENEQVEEKSLLEQTKDVVAAQKAENDRSEAIAERLEKAQSQDLLGGKSLAGQAPAEKVEETAKEYADKVMKGEV